MIQVIILIYAAILLICMFEEHVIKPIKKKK